MGPQGFKDSMKAFKGRISELRRRVADLDDLNTRKYWQRDVAALVRVYNYLAKGDFEKAYDTWRALDTNIREYLPVPLMDFLVDEVR